MPVLSVVIFSALIVGACTGTYYWLVSKRKESENKSESKLPSQQREKDGHGGESQTSNFSRKLDCMVIPSYGGTAHLPPRAVPKRNISKDNSGSLLQSVETVNLTLHSEMLRGIVDVDPPSHIQFHDINHMNVRSFENLNLLRGVGTDLKIIEHLIHEDISKELVSVRSQIQDIHMNVGECKEYIGEIMERTQRKSTSNGLVIWYTGHGEVFTGNWPFEGGYLTFSDVYKLYKCHMQGKHLYIVTDCCYSGNWVKECARHLDKENIYCGHDAEQRQIYLKVFASCLPDQQATDTLYTSPNKKGVKLEESKLIAFSKHIILASDQTTLGFDFTKKESYLCRKNEDGIITHESNLECIFGRNTLYKLARFFRQATTWEQDIDNLIEAEPNDEYIVSWED